MARTQLTTIDNDTGLAIAPTLAQALDAWRDSVTPDHLDVLAEALRDATAKLSKAIRRRNYDEAAGIAKRASQYAGMIEQHANNLGTRAGV